MKNFKNIFALLVVALVGLSLTACSEDDYDTNQYLGDVTLNVYGPSPVMRGGTLRFLGSNLDQVEQVIIPGVDPITSIEVVKAGVPSEIRVIVPHDGPQEGFVNLVTKTGKEITTKTELRYIEGLDPANITIPASALPGQKIRITVPETGDDYLDMIHMVEFADGVQVGEANFSAHTRYVIELTVPEEAKTGKLNLYTADLTVTEVAESNVEYQIITTENAIEIGTPTITAFSSPRGAAQQGAIVAKAGETITITGEHFNLVDYVKVGNVDIDEPAINGNSITFALPEDAADGDILLVTKSGVEVPVGAFTSVKPSNAVAAPAPVKAGEVLTISGADMDVVVAVEFPNSTSLSGDFVTVAADKVVVAAVPGTATEGNLVLRMANGAGVEVPFTLVKPTVTGYSSTSVSAGGSLTINGTDLDLIKSVLFGEGSDVVKVENATATAITIEKVPMNAKNGKPTLTLENGETIEGPELNISEALFCYVTELPGDDAEIKAGESLVLPVANGDKLTGVQINGADCQFVLTNNNTELIIGVPDKAKKGSQLRLISSNGEITYNIDFIPNTEVTTVLWTGQAVVDDWANQPYVLSDAGQELKDAGVVAGDVISFHITPLASDWKIQFVEGHWGPTYASICSIGNDTEGGKFTEYDLDANKGYYSIVMTQEMLDAAFAQQWWGGVFVLNGDNVVIDKITTTHYESLETTLWTGEAVIDDWGNQPTFFSDGGTELVEAGLKVGSIIRFYLTPLEESWNCQVWDGHWHGTFAGCDFSQGNWNLADHNGAIEFEVTEAIYAELTTAGGWGNAMLLNGDNAKCTKVTIE